MSEINVSAPCTHPACVVDCEDGSDASLDSFHWRSLGREQEMTSLAAAAAVTTSQLTFVLSGANDTAHRL